MQNVKGMAKRNAASLQKNGIWAGQRGCGSERDSPRTYVG
jgi:hypothetical protein